MKSKVDGTEYLWQADVVFWGRHSPILFPIVGKLKEDCYNFEEKSYNMNQHGFARDREFSISKNEPNTISFTLTDDDETLKIYPFNFELTIEYKLMNNSVLVNYLVKNISEKKVMPFSIGAHPGFNLPLDDRTSFEDYYFEISPKRTRKYIPVSEDVLLQMNNAELVSKNVYDLKRELFSEGVLIWETLGRTRIALKSDKTDKTIILDYDSVPYLGVWSTYPQEAPFVCIEPWCGIADTIDSNGVLDERAGINILRPHEQFQTNFKMTFK
ncbi:aldose 1-epimerase family protein [Enterococcus avium]